MENDKLCRTVLTISLMLLVFCVIGFFVVEKNSPEYILLVYSSLINLTIVGTIIVIEKCKKKKSKK